MLNELLEPFYQLQKNRRVTLGIVIVLAVCVAVTLVETLSDWYADFSSVDVQPKTTVHFLADNSSARLVTDLPNQHLFGLALTADDFLPITSLRVHLTGVIKDSNSAKSQAIISEGRETGKIYEVGDELMDGIKIYAINDDGIVLEHSGRLEKLPLVRSQLTFQDSPKSLWDNRTG